jgi:hypothetical protein
MADEPAVAALAAAVQSGLAAENARLAADNARLRVELELLRSGDAREAAALLLRALESSASLASAAAGDAAARRQVAAAPVTAVAVTAEAKPPLPLSARAPPPRAPPPPRRGVPCVLCNLELASADDYALHETLPCHLDAWCTALEAATGATLLGAPLAGPRPAAPPTAHLARAFGAAAFACVLCDRACGNVGALLEHQRGQGHQLALRNRVGDVRLALQTAARTHPEHADAAALAEAGADLKAAADLVSQIMLNAAGVAARRAGKVAAAAAAGSGGPPEEGLAAYEKKCAALVPPTAGRPPLRCAAGGAACAGAAARPLLPHLHALRSPPLCILACPPLFLKISSPEHPKGTAWR